MKNILQFLLVAFALLLDFLTFVGAGLLAYCVVGYSFSLTPHELVSENLFHVSFCVALFLIKAVDNLKSKQ